MSHLQVHELPCSCEALTSTRSRSTLQWSRWPTLIHTSHLDSGNILTLDWAGGEERVKTVPLTVPLKEQFYHHSWRSSVENKVRVKVTLMTCRFIYLTLSCLFITSCRMLSDLKHLELEWRLWVRVSLMFFFSSVLLRIISLFISLQEGVFSPKPKVVFGGKSFSGSSSSDSWCCVLVWGTGSVLHTSGGPLVPGSSLRHFSYWKLGFVNHSRF